MIEVQNLTKNYDYYEKQQGIGSSIRNVFHRKKLVKEAVKGISMHIEDGEMIGFIGPNGAGKTTTLKMLSGILTPTAGSASIDGYVPWERKNQFKKNMAIVLGQKTQLNWDLPASETFYLNSRIYELSRPTYERNRDELVEILDCKDQLNVQVRRLSLGERMKMELIAALLHKPKILFLDEPTIGLDFISQKKIRDFIEYYNKEYKATVVLTSHYMNDIESLCRRAIIISGGELVYDGLLSNIQESMNQKKIIRIRLSEEVSADRLTGFGSLKKQESNGAVIEVERENLKDTTKRILDHLPVVDFNVEEMPMEDAIAMLYKK